MYATASLLCFVAAIGFDRFNLRRAVFRRVPYETLALLILATVLGYLGLRRDGGGLAVVAFALAAVGLAAAVIYLLFGARFPRRTLTLGVGDLWPRFELPDSEGNAFDSASLMGKSAALYLFYRGDW